MAQAPPSTVAQDMVRGRRSDGKVEYYDPVVRLRKAIYGHPESEAIWDEHLGTRLKREGWLPVLNQP
eukprot:6067529-Heterocapsa_arctica.AAC.1